MEATTNGTNSSQPYKTIICYPGQSEGPSVDANLAQVFKDCGGLESGFPPALPNWLKLCLNTTMTSAGRTQDQVIEDIELGRIHPKDELYHMYRVIMGYGVLSGALIHQYPSILSEQNIGCAGHSLGTYGSLVLPCALNWFQTTSDEALETAITNSMQSIAAATRIRGQAATVEGEMIVITGGRRNGLDQENLKQWCQTLQKASNGSAEIVLHVTNGIIGVSLDRLSQLAFLSENYPLPNGMRVIKSSVYPPNHSSLLKRIDQQTCEALSQTLAANQFVEMPPGMVLHTLLQDGTAVSTVSAVARHLIFSKHLSRPFHLGGVLQQVPADGDIYPDFPI
ncbi:MAG: hypothetical protein ACOCXT_06555 [Candidatus Dojkabacteria bacterium]